MTRAVREPDDDRGEIIERFFFWWGFEMNEMRWRGHTNDTIDKNKAMGSAHSRTSACVSAQHAPTDRDGPTTWTWFTGCLLPNGAHRLQAIGGNLLTTLPDAGWQPWSSGSDSRHCQKRRCTCRAKCGDSPRKKRKTLFLRKKRCFSSMRPASSRPLKQGGVGRIAPPTGANRPRGWGKSLHPPREVVLCKNEPERGITLDRRGQRRASSTRENLA